MNDLLDEVRALLLGFRHGWLGRVRRSDVRRSHRGGLRRAVSGGPDRRAGRDHGGVPEVVRRSGTGPRARHRDRPGGAAAARGRGRCPRDRRVRGHGRAPAGEAWRRPDPGDGRRLRRLLARRARFTLVYVPFNTFFGLPTQEAQIGCMHAVARHLSPDGVFVIEAFVPDPTLFDRGQRVSAIRVEPDLVELEITKHDGVAQRSFSQHVVIREDRIRLLPVTIRYAFVDEIDVMARLAGLRPRERWADWDRTPFSSESPKHISVYELTRPENAELP